MIVFEWASGVLTWGKSTQMCSPASQALLYSIIASSVIISIVGVYVWRRFIRNQPGSKSGNQDREKSSSWFRKPARDEIVSQ